MATYTPTLLYFNQLPSSKGDLVDQATLTLIHNITLCNDDSSARTVTLYRHDGTNEFKLLDAVSLAAGETLIINYPGEGLVLPSTHKITGLASAASQVTCDIDGTVIT